MQLQHLITIETSGTMRGHYTTQYDSVLQSTTLYYKALYYSVLQSIYYKVLHSTTPYYTVLLRTTRYYSVLHGTTPYYSVLHSTTPYYKVLQSATPYYTVLLRTTKYILQSTTQYYSVLQSTTQYYSVLLYTTQYYSVLHGTTPYYNKVLFSVLLRTTQYYPVIQSTTQYYAALQTTTPYYTPYYKVLRSTTRYYAVLKSTTQYYSVLLAKYYTVQCVEAPWRCKTQCNCVIHDSMCWALERPGKCAEQFLELKICVSLQFRAIDPPNPARGFIQQNENLRLATAACNQKSWNLFQEEPLTCWYQKKRSLANNGTKLPNESAQEIRSNFLWITLYELQ